MLIHRILPEVVEVAWVQQKNIGFGTGIKKNTEHFCWLMPATKHVTLGFNYGAELPDPAHLLEGTGKLFRHVKINSSEQLNDPALIDFLLEHQIGIEANLTSNVQTSSVVDYASHPLKLFLEKGLCASINTDDPGISGIDLPQEYNSAAPAAGLDATMIRRTQQHGLEMAFISDSDRQTLRDKKLNINKKDS